MAKKKNDMTQNQKVGVGIGLTAAVAAAAGAYFLYGSKNATKNRKAVKSWMLKAKAEVLEKIEDAKEMSKEEYEALVKGVAATYAGIKSASKVDIKEFKDEMLEHWQAIEKATKSKNVAAKKAVKKAVKKVSKKPAKKAVKK